MVIWWLAPPYVPAPGTVHVLPGSATGVLVDQRAKWSQASLRPPGPAARDDRFGASLAAGQYGLSGHIDLAVANPLAGAKAAGRVWTMYGTANGVSAAGHQEWHQGAAGVLGADEAGDRQGVLK